MLSSSSSLSVHSFRDLRDYFQTLGDGARLGILDSLASSPDDLKVSDLARAVKMSQPLCSWHLRSLVRVGLVKMHRVGREVRCSLDRTRLEEYERAFSKLIIERQPRTKARGASRQKQI